MTCCLSSEGNYSEGDKNHKQQRSAYIFVISLVQELFGMPSYISFISCGYKYDHKHVTALWNSLQICNKDSPPFFNQDAENTLTWVMYEFVLISSHKFPSSQAVTVGRRENLQTYVIYYGLYQSLPVLHSTHEPTPLPWNYMGENLDFDREVVDHSSFDLYWYSLPCVWA